MEGGPFRDLLERNPRDAKRDERLKTSGPLKEFQYEGVKWPLSSATAFYDYLYVKALAESDELSERLQEFRAFTDIAFNPKKSQSCQARSAALFVVLRSADSIADAVLDRDSFLEKHERSVVCDDRGRLYDPSSQ